MHFIMEDEFKNKLNFLDITISKDNNNITYSIYRKPISNGIFIPNDSCNPPEHKVAAVRYLTNRLSRYAMNNTEKGKENDTVKQILHNNKYDTAVLNIVSRTKNEQECKQEKSQTRWVKFVYVEKQTKFFTKLFKNSNRKMSSRPKTLKEN